MTKISDTPAMAPAKNWKPKGRAIRKKKKLVFFRFLQVHQSSYVFVRVQTFYKIKEEVKETQKKKK